ncbi:hypothetical protein WA026_005739 [Henosepilachna vigintioctopunctata]|uniref:Lipase n=1 Tax=Henosepilachna vigintioctopunctata TaxID=420089 RepID=A0AAW1TVX3_9CUCU
MKTRNYILCFILSVLTSVLFYYNSSKNNVCKNYSDYLMIHSSENCWYEPGYYGEVPQIVLRRNQSLETYYTVTEDNYILKTFRMVPKCEPKAIVLLDHSFIANAEMWVDKGDLSLGFYLLERGYEVWMGNFRGSKYSNTNVKYTVDDYAYWNFGFHEQGVYDIKSQIDLIKKITNKNDIVFIGYSMAGTSSLVYASLHPEHAQNSVSALINVGGVFHLRNMKGLGPDMANFFYRYKFLELMNWLRIGSFPYGTILRLIKFSACNSHPFKYFCIYLYQPLIGFSKTELDASNAPIIIKKLPDGGSTKAILHFSQIYNTGGKFRLFDYGLKKNLEHYNSTEPPLYPLNRIKVPVFTYHGSEDFFTDLKDVEELYQELSPQAKIYGHKEVKGYNHFDLMYGKNREKDVYEHLLQLLERIRFKN